MALLLTCLLTCLRLAPSLSAGHQLMPSTIRLKAGISAFIVTLEDNVILDSFRELLPLTLQLIELNWNEKYVKFSAEFKVYPVHPGTIQTGDLMLYGNNKLVLFYKTFSTRYACTWLARIIDPDGLEKALGKGDVRVDH